MCQDTEAIGRLAAEKLIELIEYPKAAIIDRFTVDGILFKGGSVRDIRQETAAVPLRKSM
jgi:LacI family transcriptional regulator/LacI family purine nucleotide synthesis repressor